MTEQRNNITNSDILASTAAGISLSELRKHFENRFKVDSLTATWMTHYFLETLPQAIEDDPDLIKQLEGLAREISAYLQGGAKKANEAINN